MTEVFLGCFTSQFECVTGCLLLITRLQPCTFEGYCCKVDWLNKNNTPTLCSSELHQEEGKSLLIVVVS